jgi:hypothetical protein
MAARPRAPRRVEALDGMVFHLDEAEEEDETFEAPSPSEEPDSDRESSHTAGDGDPLAEPGFHFAAQVTAEELERRLPLPHPTRSPVLRPFSGIRGSPPLAALDPPSESSAVREWRLVSVPHSRRRRARHGFGGGHVVRRFAGWARGCHCPSAHRF